MPLESSRARRALGAALLSGLALVIVPAAASAASGATAAAAKPTTMHLSSSLDPSTAGAVVTFSATVSPAVNGGTLTFTLDGNAIPGCTAIQMNGLFGVDCAAQISTPGAYTIAATYSGDGRYGASSRFLTQTVVEPQTSGAQTGAVGVYIKGDPSLTAGSPTISYIESGSVSSSVCTLDAHATPCGAASTTLSKLSSGEHTFVITVSGGGASATAEASWLTLTGPAATSPAKKPVADPAKPKPKKKKPKPNSGK